MDAIIVGDSHTPAILNAYDRRRTTDESLPAIAFAAVFSANRTLKPFFATSQERIGFTEKDLVESCLRATARPYLVQRGEPVPIGLCLGFHTAFVYRTFGWKTHVPWRLAGLLPDCQPVSDGAMRSMFDGISQHIRAFYAALAELGCQAFVIMAPPPQARHRIIQRQGMPAAVLKHVDESYREYMVDYIESLAIPLIRAPGEVYDRDGFLKPCYWSKKEHDQHHANIDYGDLMLDQVLRHLRRAGEPSASFLPSEERLKTRGCSGA